LSDTVTAEGYRIAAAQGSLRDRDMHAGQHHVPLALLRVPVAAR
jgi:hypothetical protein